MFSIPYALAVARLDDAADDTCTGDCTVTFDKADISIVGPDSSIRIARSAIIGVYFTEGYIGIRWLKSFKHKRLLVLPRAALTNVPDVMSYLGMGRFVAPLHRPAAVPGEPAPYPHVVPQQAPVIVIQTVPYLLGLLGIIPFIGAINGIVMVIMGIVKYKNVWYSVLGALGIFFTVFIVLLFHNLTPDTNSTLFKQPDEQMAQTDLNALVKDIEFYKLQHNQYPDSLAQLDMKDSFTSIDDPIFSFRHMGDRKTVLFNYKRIGNKYTLFSSGWDGKPHTADDIYPNMPITDSTKVGLIREK